MIVQEIPPEPIRPVIQVTLDWNEAYDIFYALNFWKAHLNGIVTYASNASLCLSPGIAKTASDLADQLKPFVMAEDQR